VRGSSAAASTQITDRLAAELGIDYGPRPTPLEITAGKLTGRLTGPDH